jgi:hypothetical protein
MYVKVKVWTIPNSEDNAPVTPGGEKLKLVVPPSRKSHRAPYLGGFSDISFKSRPTPSYSRTNSTASLLAALPRKYFPLKTNDNKTCLRKTDRSGSTWVRTVERHRSEGTVVLRMVESLGNHLYASLRGRLTLDTICYQLYGTARTEVCGR